MKHFNIEQKNQAISESWGLLWYYTISYSTGHCYKMYRSQR